MKDIRQEFWESPTVVKSFIDRPPSSYITKVLDYFIKNKPDWKVLDIGCGGGRYSKYLKDHNINITAIDKHEKITMALQENEVPFILANMSSIPLKGSAFNLILSIGVLHNTISWNEFRNSISEVSRLLLPKGYFLCSIFTNDVISMDLTPQKDQFFLISDKLPMLLLSKNDIDEIFSKYKLKKVRIINEHITNVGTGERYVYTALFQKV